ncbi:hypothetical protein K3495_g6888 [Podosphaera aphanis]|nr:hypothetical protein K3495_g6888 [Podosphaera aphanis]
MYHQNQAVEQDSSRKIYLINQAKWLPWINIIKAKATRGCTEDVWQYIDPSKTTQPQLPENPQEPHPRDIKSTAATILDLNAEEFSELQYLEKTLCYKN